MGSKRIVFDIFPLRRRAMAPVVASARSAQTTSAATDSPSGRDDRAQPSRAWPYEEPFPRNIPDDQSAYSVLDDPGGRSLCVL